MREGGDLPEFLPDFLLSQGGEVEVDVLFPLYAAARLTSSGWPCETTSRAARSFIVGA